ncbi:hypothetical protein Tco_0398526 [Tanacetum coccineum]
MPSLISCRMAAKVMAGVSDVDVLLGGILSTKDNTGYDKDEDNDANGGNDDERTIIEEEDGNGFRFYGGNSFSKNKGNIDDQIVRDGRYIERWSQNSWEITVVILVRDRCPRGKGNLPRLPIRTNIVRLATPSMGIPTGAVTPNRSIHNIRVHSQCK